LIEIRKTSDSLIITQLSGYTNVLCW